jgi:hypothetical protein
MTTATTTSIFLLETGCIFSTAACPLKQLVSSLALSVKEIFEPYFWEVPTLTEMYVDGKMTMLQTFFKLPKLTDNVANSSSAQPIA